MKLKFLRALRLRLECGDFERINKRVLAATASRRVCFFFPKKL
jgi:hypothetical protein